MVLYAFPREAWERDENLAEAKGECRLVTLIAGKAQKQGRFRLRSFLASLGTVELVKKPRHPDEMDFVASVRVLLSENSRLQAILGSHFFGDIRSA